MRPRCGGKKDKGHTRQQAYLWCNRTSNRPASRVSPLNCWRSRLKKLSLLFSVHFLGWKGGERGRLLISFASDIANVAPTPRIDPLIKTARFPIRGVGWRLGMRVGLGVERGWGQEGRGGREV